MSHRGSRVGGRAGQVRAELLRHYRRIRRLRRAMLGVVAFGLIAVATVAAAGDRLGHDPGFSVLDEVAVPVLDTESAHESVYGNRWCIGQCRVRERVWESTVPVPATRDAIVRTLDGRGWRTAADCDVADGVERLCLRRDEFLLDIWIAPSGLDTRTVDDTAVVTAVARQMTGPAAGLSGSAVRSTLLVRAS